MRKNFKQLLILFCLIVILVLPYFVFAQSSALKKLETVGSTEGPYSAATETSVSEILGTAVNVLLGMLGTIFIILIIIAGFNWMIAAGDEEKLTKAKNTIRRAIIGLLIVAASYAIWYFIYAWVIINKVSV